LLGKVNAFVFVNLTVPFGACICPLVRVTDPPILNIPVDTLILPEVNTNEPTDKVPDPKVTVPVLTWV